MFRAADPASDLSLPFPTMGRLLYTGLGLCQPGLTIPYHTSDLGRNLPRGTFTNCYHRGHTTHNGTRHHVAGGWVGHGGKSGQGGEPWQSLRKDRHGGGRYRKEKNLLSGRHATEPYGGKTGGAMIKYPHTKKNAQARFCPYYQIRKYISVCTITSSP